MLVSLLTLFLIALSGCEKSVTHLDYMPLRDGNHWEYRLLDRPLLQRMKAGQTVTTAPLDAALDETAGQAPAAPQNTARRVVLELHEGVDDLTYRAIYDTKEQVWSKRKGYIGFQSPRGREYLLILPPHTGYRWIVTSPEKQDWFFEIETAYGLLSTPAGDFRGCAVSRQESRDRTEVYRYWFAPGVGLVRRSKYFAGEEVFRQELVSYKVQPATPAARLAEEREVRVAVAGKERGTEYRHRVGGIRQTEDPEDDPQWGKIEKYGEPR